MFQTLNPSSSSKLFTSTDKFAPVIHHDPPKLDASQRWNSWLVYPLRWEREPNGGLNGLAKDGHQIPKWCSNIVFIPCGYIHYISKKNLSNIVCLDFCRMEDTLHQQFFVCVCKQVTRPLWSSWSWWKDNTLVTLVAMADIWTCRFGNASLHCNQQSNIRKTADYWSISIS